MSGAPEHAVGQRGAQGGGAEVGDVPPVEALFRQGDAHNHLIVVDVQQDLGANTQISQRGKKKHYTNIRHANRHD